MGKVKAAISSPVWAKAGKQAADPGRVEHYLELLAETPVATALKRASAEQARIWASIFSGSQALSSLLVAQPAWLTSLIPQELAFGRRKEGLLQERNQWLDELMTAGDFAGALTRIREFKARELLRIGARDLSRLAKLPEIIRELSDVADICLETVWLVCLRQMEQRYGRPYHRDPQGRWHSTQACVLGMGKLGGQELNYSSDVDLLFVYSEEGEVHREAPSSAAENKGRKKGAATSTGQRPTLVNHQFFNRVAEAFIAEATRLGPLGALYRVDMRLRPEGDAGPLTRSLAGYENYYAQWGQTWERMMLIKARAVAGDAGVAAEFLEMVHPFRYPRSVN